jgi:soluble lytic murein transglycosylase
MKWTGVGVVALLSASAVFAYDYRQTVSSVIPSAVPSFAATLKSDIESHVLRNELAEKDAQIEALKAQLAAQSDEQWYEEAEKLGIVSQVAKSKLPAHQQRRLAVAIVREARKNQIDPLLVVAVIRTESAFNNYAVSHVGAMGLMQVMPATGKWLAERRGLQFGRPTNLFDSELNVELGTWYLSELIQQFGTVDKALVAYNAGPGLAKKILAKPDVRKRFMAGYPAKVVGEQKKLRAAYERETVRRATASNTVDQAG